MNRLLVNLFNKTKQQIFCCFVLLNLFWLFACNGSGAASEHVIKFSASSIILKYKPNDQFKHGDFIKINNTVFKADSLFGLTKQKSSATLVYLPSSQYVYDKIENRSLYEKISVMGCMQVLGLSILRYCDTNNIQVNLQPLLISGELKISSKNNTNLEVEVNKNFPLHVAIDKN